MRPDQQEVVIKDYHYDVVENHINMTVDVDTSGDDIADVKNVPVMMPGDQLRIMIGFDKQFVTQATLYKHNHDSNIERVYFSK